MGTALAEKTRTGSAKKEARPSIERPEFTDSADHHQARDERAYKGIRCAVCKLRKQTAEERVKGKHYLLGETFFYCKQCGVYLCKQGSKWQKSKKTNLADYIKPGEERRCWEGWHDTWIKYHREKCDMEEDLGTSYNPKLIKYTK